MTIENNNNQISKDNEVQEKIIPIKARLVRSALAKKLLIKGESLKEFEEMRAKILSEMLIQTEMENILAEKIISAQWKLRRAREIERNILNDQNAIKEYEETNPWSPERKRIRNIKKVRLNNPEIQYILQHQIDLEKSFQKSLERLREEQKLNGGQVSVPKNYEK